MSEEWRKAFFGLELRVKNIEDKNSQRPKDKTTDSEILEYIAGLTHQIHGLATLVDLHMRTLIKTITDIADRAENGAFHFSSK